MSSQFKNRLISLVKQIPSGKVVSYGQVALMLGVPQAARAVGQSLNSLEDEIYAKKIPWWRVVNNAGRISIKGTKFHNAQMQKELLQKEGLKINKDLTFDINAYRWQPNTQEIKQFELSEENIEKLISKYYL